MADGETNPAALVAHDPAWERAAAAALTTLGAALADLPGADRMRLDHIGSTAVPGLAAKPFLDLQLRILPLPDEAALAPRLRPLGYERALGSRPDSPGVHRDIPHGDEEVAPKVWEKSIWVHAGGAHILHVRRADSPWGRYTIWFRDWLRAHPDQRDRYEVVKRELSRQEVGKAGYDDYTRGKSAFFADVHEAFASWATSAPR